MTDAPLDRYAESRRLKLWIECCHAVDLGRALPGDAALMQLLHGCTPVQLEAAFAELWRGGQLQTHRLASGKRRVRVKVVAWSAWTPLATGAVAVAAE